MGCMCAKCSKVSGILFLVLGLLFLLRDLGTWDFWGISWWTALFVLFGVMMMASSHCKACNSCGSGKKKK